jgi:glycosyltransferase involved in cell wall biosynthesis
MAPRVSVVMPTYNRADTILRAIDSVRAQTFQDWELLVTDDGSTDGTAARIAGLDPRIRVFVQENQGISGARNRGMRESTGALIAFLDSDDEWLPHHLELCVAFFDAHPNENLVTNEFWFDYGTGTYEKHFWASFAQWFTPIARSIGSHSLDLPPGETDDYMRAFSSREPIGAWGRAILDKTPYKEAQHYRGNLFPAWRWGWCMGMQSTVFTRDAMKRVGFLDPHYRTASDFGYMAKLCKLYTCNLLSLPACIKHEYAAEGKELAQDHIATGKSALWFAQELLEWHEVLYWNDATTDKELTALRAYCQFYCGRIALNQGRREVAMEYFAQASRGVPGLECHAHLLLVKALGDTALANRGSKFLFRTWSKTRAMRVRLEALRGRFSNGKSADVAPRT